MALQVKRTKSKRVFPPPKAAAPTRGRRKQILEKAAAAEKADRKKRLAAERRRLKAIEKKHAARLAARQAARQAALKAVLLPFVIARDGVREFAKALHRAILRLGKKAMGATRWMAATAVAMLRLLDPRPVIGFFGNKTLVFLALAASIVILGLVAVKAAVAWLPRLNPLPYLWLGSRRALANLKKGGAILKKGGARLTGFTGGLVTGFAEKLRNISCHFRPRRLLTYSYAAAIGASLVVVGGQIALQMSGDREDRRATEKMASYQAVNNVPAETAAAIAILRDESEIFVRPPLVYDLAEEKALAMNRAPEPEAEPLIQAPAQGREPTGQRNTEPDAQSPTTSRIPTARPAPDYSTAYAYSPAQPVIAVVIDDMGMVQGELKRFATLPAEVTFAFLPYSPNLEYQTRVIRDNGHEMIVHLPMEPKRATANPGPHALLTRLSDGELRQRIAWNLGRFEGFAGINNHMGSRFTEDPRVMRAVMSALKTRNLYFLDSMTTSRSVGVPMAMEYGVPQAQRDIFLDNKRDYDSILKQLRKAERIAERRGHAIAIGHPHRITYQVLRDWVPTLRRKGIRLVALSSLIQRPAPNTQIAENSIATELSRDMPMPSGMESSAGSGRAIASSGAAGLR